VSDREVFDVKEGEILTCKKSGNKIRDGFSRCFSSINGWADAPFAPTPGKELKWLEYFVSQFCGAVEAQIALNPLLIESVGGGAMYVRLLSWGLAIPDEDYDAAVKRFMVLEDVEFLGIAATEHKAEKIVRFDQGFVACVSGVRTVINESGETLHPGDDLTFDLPVQLPNEEGIHANKLRFCFRKHRGIKDIYFPVVGRVLSYSRNNSRLDILLIPQRKWSKIVDSGSLPETLRR